MGLKLKILTGMHLIAMFVLKVWDTERCVQSATEGEYYFLAHISVFLFFYYFF